MNNTKVKHYRRKWSYSFLSGESPDQCALVAPNAFNMGLQDSLQ